MSNSKNKKELAIETLLKPKMAKTKKEVIQIMENLTTGYDPENDPLNDVLFIKDRLTQIKDGCFSQKALSYSSEIVEGLRIGQIRYITARLNGASQEQIEAIRKENKKILNAKNNMREKLDFSERNEKNVEFTFKIKTPRGESDYLSPPIKYHADFEDLYKDFQVNSGQNEQFKITMKIEIKSTRRTGNDYFDLYRHFLSRPPLRMSPVPDIVREVRNKQKELLQGINLIERYIQKLFERRFSRYSDALQFAQVMLQEKFSQSNFRLMIGAGLKQHPLTGHEILRRVELYHSNTKTPGRPKGSTKKAAVKKRGRPAGSKNKGKK